MSSVLFLRDLDPSPVVQIFGVDWRAQQLSKSGLLFQTLTLNQNVVNYVNLCHTLCS